MTTFLQRAFNFLWLPLCIIFFWEAWSRVMTNLFFPPPSEIGSAFTSLDLGTFWSEALWPTILLLLKGYLTGSMLGVVSGILVGAHPFSRSLAYPIAAFLRAVPSAAKLPVILGIVGIGPNALYLTVTVAVFLDVALVSMLGVDRVSEKRLESARILNLGWARTTFGVRLPAAMADILIGLQSALQVAILVTILVETLASGFGLGSYLQSASSLYRFPEMWIGLIAIGLIGVIGNEAFHLLERAVVPWYFATRVSQ